MSEPIQQAHSRVRLTADPFRLFFPLGLLLGIVGVSLWPFYFKGWLPAYPAVLHSRVMIEGFMAAFVFGFLSTAGPRLVSARPLSPGEFTVLLTLQVLTMTAHFSGAHATGDLLFFVLLLSFGVVLGRRFLSSRELPPPNFVLVGLGIFSALAGTGLVLLSSLNPVFTPVYLLGNRLLNEAFLLLPILGVGVFLFPRLLGMSSEGPGALDAWSPLWAHKAKLAALTGILVIVSFPIEIWMSPMLGALLRALACTGYLKTQSPGLFRFDRVPVLGWCVRVGIWCMLTGVFAMSFFPNQRLAGLHTMVIGGFSLITFTVGTRVILGHSGQSHFFATKLPFLIWTASLLGLSFLTRAFAEFFPASRNSHLVYAALVWVAAALVWGIRLLPSLTVPDSE